MNSYNTIRSNFKRLVEYQTFKIEDVEDPHFVVAEDNLDPNLTELEPSPEQPNMPDTSTQPTELPPSEPEVPVQQPQEPITPPSPPVQQVAPQPEFDYTRVVTNLNDITMSLYKLNNKFDEVKSKMEYMEKIVDEVREPSNEEKLLSQTKQSYPFNVSMVDAWKNIMDDPNESEIISTPEGEIKKIGDEYEMEVDIDRFPKPVYNNSLGRTF